MVTKVILPSHQTSLDTFALHISFATQRKIMWIQFRGGWFLANLLKALLFCIHKCTCGLRRGLKDFCTLNQEGFYGEKTKETLGTSVLQYGDLSLPRTVRSTC